jgi:CxxC motif-containing protein
MLLFLTAQNVRVDIHEGEGKIEITFPEFEGTYDEVKETESYVIYRTKTGETRFIVPYPSGAFIGMYSEDGDRLVYSGKVPVMRRMKPGVYMVSMSYRGYSWSDKVEIKEGMNNILYVKYLGKEERTEEMEETEDYVILHHPSKYTYLKIQDPVGCRVRVKTESGRSVHSSTIPTGKHLKPGFYVVEVRCGGRKKSVKVEVKEDMENVLTVKMGASEEREPMSPEAFAALLNMLDEASFSDEKYNIVKEAASKNYFTSKQILKILNKFSFEDDKLKTAKLLYPRAVDPENFFVVYDAFTFSSSKEELRKWVEKYDREHGR